jgi:hypothetical protein
MTSLLHVFEVALENEPASSRSLDGVDGRLKPGQDNLA